MTKIKNTKRALLMSALTLLVCVSMLIGSTFAWFTDSVTSGSNVIKSGNLDLTVEYTLDGNNWANLDGAGDLFNKGPWEPGHTEVVALRIKNNGTLALKYAANMNIVSETIGKTKDGADIKLSDILTVSTLIQQAIDENGSANMVGDITLGLAFSGENKVSYKSTKAFKAGNILSNDEELQPGAAHYLIVKIDMAETVGNEANHNGADVPSITFGVNVLATQFTYEDDSFGNQYDKDAEYPVIMVSTAADLKEAAANITEDTTLYISDDISMDGGSAIHTNGSKGTITIDGNGKTIESSASSVDDFQWEGGTIPAMSTIFSSADGSKVTVNGLKFTGTMSSIMLGNYVNASYNKFDTELNNVDVIGTEVVSFSANIAPAVTVYGKAVLNNCNIYGTTLSELDTVLWPVYDLALSNYSTTTLNNSKVGSIYMWNQANLTIDGNSEVDSIVVLNKVSSKFAITVKGGSTVGTIDLSKIDASYEDKVTITIEDGATVGAFVDNGVSYDTLDAWKAANN